MPDPLTDQLIQRQLQDPQAAWQKASSIGADTMKPMEAGLPRGVPDPISILKLIREMNIPKLGQRIAEFSPVGEEGAYNALRQGAQKLIDPAEQAYLRILGKGGR